MKTKYSVPVRIVGGNAPGGPAILDENGKLPASVMPDGSGGGGGYSIETQEIHSETFTAEDGGGQNFATLSYEGEPFDQDVLIITFDGVEYECPRQVFEGQYLYGATVTDSGPDYSACPFMLFNDDEYTIVYTETAGSHSISINAETVIVDEDFCKAANSCAGPVIYKVSYDQDNSIYFINVTIDEFRDVFLNHLVIIKDPTGVYHYATYFDLDNHIFGADVYTFEYSDDRQRFETQGIS